MIYAVLAILTGLLCFSFYLYQRQRLRDVEVRINECGFLIKHWTKEPFSAFDFQMAMHVDIPLLYRHHQRYGSTFQVQALITLPSIMTIAPENIRAINTGKDWGVEPLRLAGMEYFCGRGFLTTDGDIWQHSRKSLKPTFTKSNLLDLGTLSQQMDLLLIQIPGDGATVDLQPLFYKLFLNTSINFLLGKDPTASSVGSPYTSEEFINSFHDALFYTMIRILLGKAWGLLPQKRYLNACKIAHEYLDYYINEALNENARSNPSHDGTSYLGCKPSMLGSLSNQTNDRTFIRNQILQGMMASQETTSALLGNACFLLSRHPIYWQKIRSATLDQDLSYFSFDKLLEFKLLQNILLETLRLYPIFPLLARVALRDTKLPVGGGPDQDMPVFVSKGTLVVMSYFALHRDPAVFGSDVETFWPERWEKIHHGQWEFMGFGGGNRTCLGQQKVLVEAAYVLIRIAKRYGRLESRDDAKWEGELKLTCKSKGGCKVALLP